MNDSEYTAGSKSYKVAQLSEYSASVYNVHSLKTGLFLCLQ